MNKQDPRQVIIDRLRILSGSQGMSERDVQFLKERSSAQRQVQAVTFQNASGHEELFICYLEQDEQGNWRFLGGAGSSTNGTSSGQKGLHYTHPWVNLGGGGWPDHFFAGGYVSNAGLSVVRVRLVAANGTIMEDTVDNNIVLFLSTQSVEIPIRAELYDSTGNLVGEHDAFNVIRS